jgi:hypothetical protein
MNSHYGKLLCNHILPPQQGKLDVYKEKLGLTKITMS